MYFLHPRFGASETDFLCMADTSLDFFSKKKATLSEIGINLQEILQQLCSKWPAAAGSKHYKAITATTVDTTPDTTPPTNRARCKTFCLGVSSSPKRLMWNSGG